jgi:hypothetical protein
VPLRKIAVWNRDAHQRRVVSLWGDEDEIQLDLAPSELMLVIYNVSDAEVLTEAE